MAATVSDFYQKHKLPSLLLVAFTPSDLEIGGKVRRVVLTTFFERKNKFLYPYFHIWLVKENMVRKRDLSHEERLTPKIFERKGPFIFSNCYSCWMPLFYMHTNI